MEKKEKMRLPKLKGWRCVICKQKTRYNVGFRTVPLCPECYQDPKAQKKFLKWLYIKDRKMYWKQIKRGFPPLSDNYG